MSKLTPQKRKVVRIVAAVALMVAISAATVVAFSRDDAEGTYLDTLTDSDVVVHDPAFMTTIARDVVCHGLRTGESRSDIHSSLANFGTAAPQSEVITAAAVAAYCPEFSP